MGKGKESLKGYRIFLRSSTLTVLKKGNLEEEKNAESVEKIEKKLFKRYECLNDEITKVVILNLMTVYFRDRRPLGIAIMDI